MLVTAEIDHEAKRLAALSGLELDQTASEERLNRITRVAAALFDVPIAMINLITSDQVLFKSCVGLTQGGTLDRSGSFCALAADQNEPLMVPDATINDELKNNPLVIGELKIRSYIGKSLHTADGFRIATLCLLDKKPRKYSLKQLRLLEDLAKWAEIELNTPVKYKT